MRLLVDWCFWSARAVGLLGLLVYWAFGLLGLSVYWGACPELAAQKPLQPLEMESQSPTGPGEVRMLILLFVGLVLSWTLAKFVS